MRTTIVLFTVMMTAASASAQDRGVSIPDVHTLYADDAFVAQELTVALRTAGGMTSGWRLSTVDVPFAELLRACETDVAATLSCMAEQVVTRDPSMRDGLILFALLERNGGGMAVLHLNLRLYDMRTGELAGSLQVDVQRITAPAARNREAAEWIRQLLAPPPRVEVAEARPAESVIDEAAVASPDVVEVSEPPVAPPEEIPVEPPRPATDFTGIDVAAWVMIGTAIASAIAAGITGGLVLSLNGDERYNAYRSSWDASLVPDICRVAADDPSSEGRHAHGVCQDAGSLEIASHALWAAFGALGVAGALTFLIPRVGSSDAPTEVTLVPSVAPTRAGLDLRVTF